MKRALNIAGILALAAGTASGSIGFSAPVSYATPERPSGVVTGDFNGDTFVDMAVTTDNPDKVSIMLNTGNGTFAAPVNVLTGAGTGPGFIVAGDFDGDSDMDLAVALQNTGQVRVLVNTAGVFTLGATAAVGANPRWIAAARLDSGTSLDLAVANRDSNNVTVLLNGGAGTFSGATVAAGADPRGIAATDLSGDGRPELVVSNHDDRTLSILSNNGSGVFAAGGTVSVGSQLRPDGLVAADLDGDTDLDIAVSTSGNGLNFASVLLNQAGGLSGPVNFGLGGGINPGGIVATDLDGDGDRELVTANQDSGNISVLDGNGNGTFVVGVVFATGAAPSHVAAGDFDGDQMPDVAVSNRDANTTSVLINSLNAPVLCYANCDGSSLVPILNVSDFVCFNNRYQAGDSYANCDGSSVAPVLNVSDFICFMNRFAAGCP